MPDRSLARLTVLGAAALAASACGTFRDAPMSDPAVETVVEVPAPPRPAATRAAPAPTAARPVVAEYASGETTVPLRAGAPERYVVRRGDTLWDISGLFLDDPWLWPEIWYVNPQIDNPHLIYPGDVLRLVYIDGQPRIMLERDVVASDVRMGPAVRYESLDEAIAAIPYEAIAAFLSKPTVLSKRQIRDAPYILDIRESHLIAGSGFHVYVRGADGAPGSRYRVYHVGGPLHDPDTGKMLGYEGLYVGEGRITESGDPATMFLTETKREALIGDRLVFEDPSLPLNFFPKAPAQPIDGRIMSVVDGVSLIGTYQIVSLNVGADDGIVPGDVLSVYRTGEVVEDRYAATRGLRGLFGNRRVRLPDVHAGELMVIRVMDEVSFGLIMHATSEIEVLDTVRNPD